MAKKKHKPGQSGNPAKRAHQDALRHVFAPPGSVQGSSFEVFVYYDDDAHEALSGRGWIADRSEGDMWEWSPSQVEGDHDTETYYEPTYVTPVEDGGLCVDLAGRSDGPFNLAWYESVDKLLADVDDLESYRHGDSFPALAHASATAQDSSSPVLLGPAG